MLSSLAFDIKKKCGKPLVTIIAVVLFFSLFAYWKFEGALTNPEMCLTNFGDGIGGLGDIFSLKQAADEEGLGVLFTDTFSSKKNGFGLAVPNPMSVTWKWNLWTLSHFFSPKDVYNINALLAFVFIGVFGFILLRELGVSIFFSMLGAVILTHMDHFFSRLNGHLIGLGTYYFPILLCWGAVRAGKRPTLPRLMVFVACNVLNFQVNEYYGYYGAFFSCALFFGYYLKHINKNALQLGKFAVRICVAGVAFIGLMCLFYPNLVLPKIISLFRDGTSAEVAIHNAAHGWGEFLIYSVRKPLSFFSSSVPYLKNLASGDIFKSDLGEFTFRIGLVIPLSIFVGMVFFGCSLAFGKLHKGLDTILECGIWIFALILIFFFAISPEKSISLVPITYKIAPMFRVSARAFLYIDIAVIVLFAYTMDLIVRFTLKNCGPRSSIGKRVVNASLLLLFISITVVAIIDVTGDRIWKKAPAMRLPDTALYEILAGKPEGLVLELPMYSPITHSPELNYIYMYNRTKHGFDIINTSYPPPSNIDFREVLHRLSLYFNAMSPEMIRDLKRTGVRYVVVDKEKINDSKLRNSKQMKLIADTKSKSIFETQVDEDFGRDDFLEAFIYSEHSLSFAGNFHQPERNDKTYWIWCGKSGDVIFKNHSKYDKKFVFTATFVVRAGSTLRISTPFSQDVIRIKAPSSEFNKIIDIRANSSLMMNIVSDAKPYNPSDPALVFCMYEYGARPLSLDKPPND